MKATTEISITQPFSAGVKTIQVADTSELLPKMRITISDGTNLENHLIESISNSTTITLASPLKSSYSFAIVTRQAMTLDELMKQLAELDANIDKKKTSIQIKAKVLKDMGHEVEGVDTILQRPLLGACWMQDGRLYKGQLIQGKPTGEGEIVEGVLSPQEQRRRAEEQRRKDQEEQRRRAEAEEQRRKDLEDLARQRREEEEQRRQRREEEERDRQRRRREEEEAAERRAWLIQNPEKDPNYREKVYSWGTYKGQCRAGTDVAEGYGTLTYSDGARYVGEYRNGNREGQGTLTWSDGRKYVGEWQNDRFNGQGIFTWKDGRSWKGPFRDHKMDGEGTWTDPDGCSRARTFNGVNPFTNPR